MLRKRLAILFLIVAQIVILGHSVVAHHHHIDIPGKGHHHHEQDGKHQDPDETPLELAFSGFLHTGEHVTFTNTEAAKIVASKDAAKSIKALPVDFKAPVEYIVVYQKHTFPPDRQRLYKLPQNGAHKLRGPPAFIVS